MKRILFVIGLILSAFSFVSCDVEFTPNEDWQEQMMVYSVLDQDDDTSYVRVEKVFLGNGNALHYAREKDSLYYQANDLDVKIFVYNINDTNNIVDVLQFDYTTTYKPEGEFYSGEVPLYFCKTKNRLSPDKFYKLEVTNLKTGFKATSTTYLVADYSVLTSNFTFNNNSGRSMLVKWTNVDGYNFNTNTIAKRFQINIRFNYRQNAQIHHVDMPLSAQTNTSLTAKSLETKVNKEDIVLYLKNALGGVAGISWYDAAPFEINVLGCDQEMFDYISINNATEASINFKPSYSNIKGGYGLFGARRTHISRSYSTQQVDQQLRTALNGVITFQ